MRFDTLRIGAVFGLMALYGQDSVAQTDLRLGRVVISRTIDQYDDEYTLNIPMSVTRTGDTLVVTDYRNRRVVLFEMRTLRPLRAFGSSGSGPGEFQSPTSASVTSEHLIVADDKLSRLSVFTHQGRFVRVEPLPETNNARSFIVRPDGSVLGVSQSLTHFLQRKVGGDSSHAFALRPLPIAPKVGRSHGDLVVAGFNNQVFVIDNDSGVVVAFDATGQRRGTWRVPDAIVAETNKTRAGFRPNLPPGARLGFLSFPMFLSANMLPTGELFLFHRIGYEAVGLVFNPATGSFRRILGGPELNDMDRGRTAYFDGSRLYVMQDDGIRVFAVSS